MQRLLFERDGVKANDTPGEHGLLTRIPFHRIAALQSVGEVLLDFVSRERRGEEDSGVALAIVEIDSDNEFLLPQVLHVSEVGASTIRKGISGPVGTGTPAGNAIGVGKGEQ